ANGTHTFSASASDAAANSTSSTVVSASVANANNPASIGQWSSVMNWPLVAVNTVLLYNGKILMWDGGGSNCWGSSSARVWDPATNVFTAVPVPEQQGETDIFCSGMSQLADGRVLVVGGHECTNPNYVGQANAYIFDPATMQWTVMLNAMSYRHWYPTVTTMADGRAIVIGGGDRDFTPASYSRTPEVFNPQTNTWMSLGNSNQTIPNYAFVYSLPDGRMLVAGSDEAKMATYTLNVGTQTWSVVDPAILNAGSSVMYSPGKVMKTGSSYVAGDQA